MYVTLTYLESNINNLSKLEKLSHSIVEQCNINEERFPNILISLTEAVSNAILHGNEENELKEVEISIDKTEEGISLKVSDEGVGFDYKSIPDPTTPENVVKQGGRGIFVIRDLSDKIVFLDNGSTIEMFFKYD